MTKEVASAGVLDTPFGAPATLCGKFARLQIITIGDLIAGKKPAMPPEDPAAFKRASREQHLGPVVWYNSGGGAFLWRLDHANSVRCHRRGHVPAVEPGVGVLFLAGVHVLGGTASEYAPASYQDAGRQPGRRGAWD